MFGRIIQAMDITRFIAHSEEILKDVGDNLADEIVDRYKGKK